MGETTKKRRIPLLFIICLLSYWVIVGIGVLVETGTRSMGNGPHKPAVIRIARSSIAQMIATPLRGRGFSYICSIIFLLIEDNSQLTKQYLLIAEL
jgi:hypothetical protein